MNMELDHIFILVEPEAEVADLLVSMGMEENFRREHPGQGTSNRRFMFSNGMLEFLWLRDAEEAQNGPGRNLRLFERAGSQDASPFGIVLNRKDNADLDMPFVGWTYQPDYFKPPMAFHVGLNSSNLLEPLCIYVPFMEPPVRQIEPGTFKSISRVRIYTTSDNFSDILMSANKADRVSIAQGPEHLMEITLDENQRGMSRDFRPEIPLIIYW